MLSKGVGCDDKQQAAAIAISKTWGWDWAYDVSTLRHIDLPVGHSHAKSQKGNWIYQPTLGPRLLGAGRIGNKKRVR
jgi:hypothetical protein